MAKFLVIAEKPSVAQSLAKNLSAYQRKDGYLEGNSCIVSWCLGHLAEYAPPEIYNEKYAKWQFEDLPIIPEVWKVQVSEDKKKQFDEKPNTPKKLAISRVRIHIATGIWIFMKSTGCK